MSETRRLAADKAGLAEAGRLLAAGALVAFPTETVYGLGCDATDAAAVARLYAAKGRPSFNPLIAHVPSLDEAHAIGRFNPLALRIAEAFWPGPLTLVLPLQPGQPVCDLARAGLNSIGLRIPSSPPALAVLRAAGKPVAAPSANRSGHVSPTSAAHVLADLEGRIDAVVMGEDAPVGVESTILAVDDAAVTLLRAGGIPRAAIEALIRAPVLDPMRDDSAAPLSPGRLASHYAPDAFLRLNARSAEADEAVLDFAGALAGQGAFAIDLSETGNLTEAASRLYAALRALDAKAARSIAVAPIPETGLGEAINDRLRRAAAPR